jgi:hypothetical protein
MRTKPQLKSLESAPPDRPVLHISGPKLTGCFQALIQGCERDGGIERYVEALNLKASLFQEALADGTARDMDIETFKRLCAFMAPVRRRVAPWLRPENYSTLRAGIGDLLEGATDTSTTDARIGTFCKLFPEDGKHRWVRDLAAELLHYADPERYPLMCRWIWDSKTNTGVIREIWYGENVDGMVIDVADGFETCLTLREELSQFLTDNGVFRDVLTYVDLLCALIYADYVRSQGGAFLRSDFLADEDPMQYTRRMLGLDGVKSRSARTRLKDINGEAFKLEDLNALETAEGETDAYS